jgi:hypothetical protein
MIPNMTSKKRDLVVIDGCGSEILDVILATVNYEIEGNGAILLHREDLPPATKIEVHIQTFYPDHDGLLLLRK